MHRIPSKGANCELNITNTLSSLFCQSIAFESSSVPTENYVLVNAISPVASIESMSMTTKITPDELILIKMLMSFLFEMITTITKRTIAQ